ncbi:MAG: outer membrane beta-barrel family protein, partial [Rikenellaceae bacterium]|nr:outer membrane beta-barrel family protein [Rikenellaceae bacterium]
NTDYSFNLNWYSTGGENNNYNLLNAGIGKKFLKKQNAEVRISAFDLLNQGKSISYSVNDTYTQNSVSNILKRYFMISFSYKFNTMNSGQGSVSSGGGMRVPGGRPPMGAPRPM